MQITQNVCGILTNFERNAKLINSLTSVYMYIICKFIKILEFLALFIYFESKLCVAISDGIKYLTSIGLNLFACGYMYNI